MRAELPRLQVAAEDMVRTCYSTEHNGPDVTEGLSTVGRRVLTPSDVPDTFIHLHVLLTAALQG